MRIEKISEDKIKVLIDESEAREWNITFKNISENTPEVQKMFWTAIRMAEENVDFYVDGAKLFVEAVRDCELNGNGFGMVITRVRSEEELNEAVDNCSYKGRLRRAKLDGRHRIAPKKYIFRFNDFDDVCAAVGEVYSLCGGESALYKCDDKYYLLVSPRNTALFADAQRALAEFGHKTDNSIYMHGYLNEYGELMIPENAIDVLAKYFCEI